MAFLQFGDFDVGEVQHLLEGKVAKIHLPIKKVAKIPYTNASTSLGCTSSIQFGDFAAGEVQRLLDGKEAKIHLSNKKVAKIPYTNASTSLGCPSGIQRVKSSTIPCASEEAAGRLLHALKDCSGPSVVEVFFVDGCSLIVEMVGPGVKITMNNEHLRWDQSLKDTWDQSLKESWWERSNGMFMTIFRDIVSGLSCLFKEGHFCGSLQTRGVSIQDGRAKILIAQKANSRKEFEDGVKIDLRDLHDLMVCSLTLANPGNVPNPQYFEAQRIGKDVLDFLHRLNTLVHFEQVYVLWALDHPVFWTPNLKTRFIFKLWERMFNVRTLSSASLDRYLRSIYGVFPEYLTMNAYVIKVKEYCEANNEEHSRKTYMKVSRSDSFEIVRIYRACLFHYNRYLYEGQKKRMTCNEISTIADTMLKVGVCTELANAVGYAWSISKDGAMRELMEYVHSSKAGPV